MHYDDIDRRTVQLAAALTDRLQTDDSATITQYADVGEPAEAIHLLTACLIHDRTPITAAERDELTTLTRAIDQPTTNLADLNVQGADPS